MKKKSFNKSDRKISTDQILNITKLGNDLLPSPPKKRSNATMLLSFTLLTVVSALLMQCKSTANFNASSSLSPYLIACDTITVNDSSFYQPVFFRIKENTIVHTTYDHEEFYFDILEKDSANTSAKVLFTCNDIVYDLTMKIERGGYLNFYQPEKNTRFRILRVVKSR